MLSSDSSPLFNLEPPVTERLSFKLLAGSDLEIIPAWEYDFLLFQSPETAHAYPLSIYRAERLRQLREPQRSVCAILIDGQIGGCVIFEEYAPGELLCARTPIPYPVPQEALWRGLFQLCGSAFASQIERLWAFIEVDETDTLPVLRRYGVRCSGPPQPKNITAGDEVIDQALVQLVCLDRATWARLKAQELGHLN